MITTEGAGGAATAHAASVRLAPNDAKMRAGFMSNPFSASSGVWAPWGLRGLVRQETHQGVARNMSKMFNSARFRLAVDLADGAWAAAGCGRAVIARVGGRPCVQHDDILDVNWALSRRVEPFQAIVR
jgi:hypothetical protein